MSFHVGLQKAFAGKSSSSKRKRDSSESEDWNAFSLNLHAKNLLPATVAKRNIEKGNKAGAKGLKFRGEKKAKLMLPGQCSGHTLKQLGHNCIGQNSL